MCRWGPQFGVRANTVAFGHIQTRLTAAKEAGAFITTPDGTQGPGTHGHPAEATGHGDGGGECGSGACESVDELREWRDN
jgi:hypothetical protein